MNHSELFQAGTALPKGGIHRIADGAGVRIEALSGSLWVTIDHDTRDIVLKPGQGVTIDRHGATLISALDDARFVALAATPR